MAEMPIRLREETGIIVEENFIMVPHVPKY